MVKSVARHFVQAPASPVTRTEPDKSQSTGRRPAKKRILFIAEACTLAHVIRPLVLAKALDPAEYEVHFAYAMNDLMVGKEFIFKGTNFTHWDITSQPSEVFFARAASGSPLYDYKTLKAYAEEEVRLFEKVKPDFIVGDMRWSLSTSAKASGIPFATINNVHWSAHAEPFLFPLPEFKAIQLLVQLLGEKVVTGIFDYVKIRAMNHHALPMSQLREDYHLPRFDSHLAALNAGDYVLYADVPAFLPTRGLPANQSYIGPINWAPEVAKPSWWDEVPTDRPIVYVALGSSGNASLLPEILDQLRRCKVTVIAAAPESFTGDHVFAAPYFPWDEAARRSKLMIGNGGTGAIYQCIAAGIPILGIVSNQDQVMGMSHAEVRGMGIMLRASAAHGDAIGAAVTDLLSDPCYRQASERLRAATSSYDAGRNFSRFIETVTGSAKQATL